MDIRTQLLKEHSRRNTEAIAHFVGHDAQRFAELMKLVLANEPRVAQRAAYAMSVACEENPHLTTPYLKQLIDVLDQDVHDGIHRNSIRIMQFCALPKRLHGRITETMFLRIAEPRHSIAVRAFAITVAERMVKLYPELRDEFKLLLEAALRVDPGPAIRSRATKALKALERHLRTATPHR